MKKQVQFLLLPMALTLLFLSGCNSREKNKTGGDNNSVSTESETNSSTGVNLNISNIEIAPDEPREGESFDVIVKIKNTGQQTSGNVDLKIYYKKGFGNFENFGIQKVSKKGIQAGETKTVYHTSMNIRYAGRYELHAEARETGNSETIKNSLPFNIADQLADFKIISVDVNPLPTVSAVGDNFLIRGTKYSFRVKVKNAGGPIQGAVAMAVSYGCPGKGSTNNLINLGNLAPGETRLSDPFSVKIETNSGGGQCSFEFNVDPGNYHKELDESPTSNKRVIRFKVP